MDTDDNRSERMELTLVKVGRTMFAGHMPIPTIGSIHSFISKGQGVIRAVQVSGDAVSDARREGRWTLYGFRPVSPGWPGQSCAAGAATRFSSPR